MAADELIGVTSFGPNCWDAYAREGVESMVRNLPGRLVVYYEDEVPEDAPDGIEWRPLYDIPRLWDFLEWVDQSPVLKGRTPVGYNYRWDAYKFCRKAFCQIDAVLRDSGPVYWLDADCILEKPISLDVLTGPLEDVFICYFGREGYHVEAGVVGFMGGHEAAVEFMDYYRRLYLSGAFLELRGFDDGTVLTTAIAAKEPPARNLSPEAKKEDAPIGKTHFAGYIRHDKGPRKYRRGEAA